ncbi:unnamed protein product [Psylliodes chrysocephalus]|uniref:Uncharacterized protein n=1 Tax=Psylliodes chrysocephalus TaxID=3402493 RepID=A0A9P0C813_9CUCU|nr:unnamed protein product [Psylliodes chrysocephala]
MRCYICGITAKDFNDLSKRKEKNIQAVSFGLSILHDRIRFFESLLHLAYKLSIIKWRLTSAEDKEIHAETKKRIQEPFKVELGLLVDIAKADFGNTNDGNTSRRFFQDPEISARITGIDVTLIERFKVILEALSSEHMIDVEKFSAYASETA